MGAVWEATRAVSSAVMEASSEGGRSADAGMGAKADGGGGGGGGAGVGMEAAGSDDAPEARRRRSRVAASLSDSASSVVRPFTMPATWSRLTAAPDLSSWTYWSITMACHERKVVPSSRRGGA